VSELHNFMYGGEWTIDFSHHHL